VPAVLAVTSGKLVPAALGALAAITQGLQQIWQDRRSSLEFHSAAVGLSRIRNGFELTFEDPRTTDKVVVFDKFVVEIEEYRRQSSSRLIDLTVPKEVGAAGDPQPRAE
jgi:hypothetical protein